jgi:hypothetical protein
MMRGNMTMAVGLLVGLAACAVDPSGIVDQRDASPESDLSTDGCPDDPMKEEPGICGCGVADTDSDGDGTPDCNDGCPGDPMKTDPGGCGCGVADVDADGDGSLACDDCDDDDAMRFPGAVDGCGGVDDDCDGTVDEDCAATPNGCADGTREGFVDEAMYPDIAACDSAWSIPGVFGDGLPSCDREAGNDGIRVDGIGCDIDDGCAEGWHVCGSVIEVGRLATSCDDALTGRPEEMFLAAVSGVGPAEVCSTSGSNNVAGCGLGGTETSASSCGVLNHLLVFPCQLGGAQGFDCSSGGGVTEADHVVSGGAAGGVLCCRDGA